MRDDIRSSIDCIIGFNGGVFYIYNNKDGKMMDRKQKRNEKELLKREQVEPSKNSSKQSELLAQKNILGDFEKKKAQMPDNYMSS